MVSRVVVRRVPVSATPNRGKLTDTQKLQRARRSGGNQAKSMHESLVPKMIRRPRSPFLSFEQDESQKNVYRVLGGVPATQEDE